MTLATIVVCLAGSSAEGAVRLVWDSNTEPDLAGYRLSYGTSSRNYIGTIDVGNATTFNFVEPNPTVRYYLALQAYDTDGNISAYSNEVVTTPAPSGLRLTGLSANRTSPQTVGTAITFTATATGGTTPYQFKFFVINGSTTTVARNWSTTATFTWTPTAAGSSYAIRVWARNAGSTADAAANSSSILQMSYTITASSNQPPSVNAGNDRTVTLPSSASLNGTASDDGKPVPPGKLTRTWSKASGPGTVTFGSPNAAATTASFSAAGTYVLRLTASDGALSRTDEVTVTVKASATGTGTGLTGRYYKDPTTGTHFGAFMTSRVDPEINFSWDLSGLPAPGMPLNYYSIRWTGQVQAPVTGSYRFTTISDDGVKLWINGQLVIDNWTNPTTTAKTSPPVALTAGQRYTIRLDYFERTGAAKVQLRWTPPGQTTMTVIPTNRLYPQ